MLFGSIEQKNLYKESAIVFFVKIIGAIFSFLLNVIIAKYLGASGSGVYFLALSITTIGSIIARIGLDNAVVRFVSKYIQSNDYQRVKGVYQLAIIITFILSTLVSIILYLFSPILNDWIFNEDDLTQVIQIMAISVIPQNMITIMCEIIKGFRRVVLSTALQAAFSIIIVVLIFLLKNNISLSYLSIIYSLASWVAFIVCVMIFIKFVTKITELQKPVYEFKQILSASSSLFWISILNTVMGYADIWVLGIWMNSEEVGVYNIALKITTLSSMLLLAINSVAAPRFSGLFSNKDYVGLQKNFSWISSIMLGVSSVFLIIIISFPVNILSIFGSDFESGYSVLIILAIGQFVALATGPLAILLMMTGLEKQHRNNVFSSALINIALNLILIPIIGVVGAAMATSISIILKNMIALYQAKKFLNISYLKF